MVDASSQYQKAARPEIGIREWGLLMTDLTILVWRMFMEAIEALDWKSIQFSKFNELLWRKIMLRAMQKTEGSLEVSEASKDSGPFV